MRALGWLWLAAGALFLLAVLAAGVGAAWRRRQPDDGWPFGGER